MSPHKATHVYVGTKSCGCRVAAVVDYADRDTAQEVRRMVKQGYAVTREVSPVEIPLARCVHRQSIEDQNAAILEGLKP